MHEYSIIAALVEQVEGAAEARGGRDVRRLRIEVGEAAGVEVDLLRSAYDTFRVGTICADAELVIDTVPVVWACRRCGETPAAGGGLQCAACGAPLLMVRGDDLTLRRIEMEVHDDV